MNLNRFKTAICAVIFSSVGQLIAQQPLGLVVGDLNTSYSVFMNPANVASNYSKRVYVNWWGTSLDAQSSFANSWKYPTRWWQLKAAVKSDVDASSGKIIRHAVTVVL